MGNQIRYVRNRKTKVKKIHINRPSNRSEFESEVSTEESPRFPTPTTDIVYQSNETVSLENSELSPEQFVQYDSGYSIENPNSSSHLFNAQQKLISRLERELSYAHSDLSELKVCYEQKLKRSRSNTASVKAETALIIYELRESIRRLESENGELISELLNIEKSDSEKDARKLTDAHTELILNLSEQLLTANEKLRDSNTLVEYLKQNNNNNNNSNININDIPQLNSNTVDIRIW